MWNGMARVTNIGGSLLPQSGESNVYVFSGGNTWDEWRCARGHRFLNVYTISDIVFIILLYLIKTFEIKNYRFWLFVIRS